MWIVAINEAYYPSVRYFQDLEEAKACYDFLESEPDLRDIFLAEIMESK